MSHERTGPAILAGFDSPDGVCEIIFWHEEYRSRADAYDPGVYRIGPAGMIQKRDAT